MPGERIEVLRSPLGVVGAITPWNFPIAVSVRKIAPALAYGNAVWKPSIEAALTGLATAEALLDAGLPLACSGQQRCAPSGVAGDRDGGHRSADGSSNPPPAAAFARCGVITSPSAVTRTA